MFCNKCGAEVDDECIVCPKCGCNPKGIAQNPDTLKNSVDENSKNNSNETLRLIAKVFMVIACVVSGVFILPLIWMIPMTVSYWNKCGKNEQVGIGFKVCTLIFVSVIAGILMLCDNE